MPDKPDKSVNLWSVLKNCVGKDNVKVPCPVNFMEPLSFLQGRYSKQFFEVEVGNVKFAPSKVFSFTFKVVYGQEVYGNLKKGFKLCLE